MRILVVDDEPVVLEFLDCALTRRGHHVCTVRARDDAALLATSEAAARADAPELAIVSSEMECASELIARVRAARPGIRIVLFAAGTLRPTDIRRVGGDAFLPKPCTLAELDAAVG